MLDKTTVNFLIYLNSKSRITMNEYFDYFESKKISPWITVQTFLYLTRNNYIHKNDNFIYPTIETEFLTNYLSENRRTSIFYNYILPYIHEFFIYILGLLTPLLIQLIKNILKL